MPLAARGTLVALAAVLASAAVRAEEPQGSAAAPPCASTLEELFARFVPGEPWPEWCAVPPGGPLYLIPEDAVSTPEGGPMLTGMIDGFEVTALSNPVGRKVKAVYANREAAFGAGDIARGTAEFQRVEAILQALAARKACRAVAEVEPAGAAGEGKRPEHFGVRRLRCDGQGVEMEAFVDFGERERSAGTVRTVPGRLGLRLHQKP